MFADRRIHGQPDFYRIQPQQAQAVTELAVAGESGRPNSTIEPLPYQLPGKTLNSRFDFSILDIPTGAILIFIHDATITCTVLRQHPPLVEFEAAVMKLTAAATKARVTALANALAI